MTAQGGITESMLKRLGNTKSLLSAIEAGVQRSQAISNSLI
jgi:hypothetical protein